MTGMYVPSVQRDRHRMWNALQDSLPPFSTPWMVSGDLNEVTNRGEKSGGRTFVPSQRNDFNNFSDAVAAMVDLGFHGNLYT